MHALSVITQYSNRVDRREVAAQVAAEFAAEFAAQFDIDQPDDAPTLFGHQLNAVARQRSLRNLDVVVVVGVEEAEQSALQPLGFIARLVWANRQHGSPVGLLRVLGECADNPTSRRGRSIATQEENMPEP